MAVGRLWKNNLVRTEKMYNFTRCLGLHGLIAAGKIVSLPDVKGSLPAKTEDKSIPKIK